MKKRLILAAIVFALAAPVFAGAYLEVLVSTNIFSYNKETKKGVVLGQNLTEVTLSDQRQVSQGLKKGGTIKICFDADYLDETFYCTGPSGSLLDSYDTFGAYDNDGYYYVRGAALNYIMSKGWTLFEIDRENYGNYVTAYIFIK